ncbi:MAG TPA: NAD-dependent epimerase/dehydratase family protein [Polyangiaceae bacterium]|nr:NAD-dependent epimerase/dehydratase family protein [Polyangiaceae bacterium]
MRYWVGGATGFLGSHLVERLVAEGHEVVGVARGGGSVAGVPVVALDVLDAAAVARTAESVDGAFLATGKVSRDANDAEEMHRANVLGTRSALEGLRRAGVPRVVYASTSGTIAISTEPDILDETADAPLEHLARWPYYRSKFYAELDALETNGEGGLDVVVVNPSLLLGPGDLRGSSTSDIRRFLDGEVLAAPRGGIAVVDVRDVAVAMIAALERGRSGERYLLNAANLTVPAFLDRLERISGVSAPAAKLPRSRGVAVEATRLFGKMVKAVGGELPMSVESVEMAQYYWYCDSGKAMRELGFAPRDLTETLRDTISDLLARGVANPRTGALRETVPRAIAARANRLLGESDAE